MQDDIRYAFNASASTRPPTTRQPWAPQASIEWLSLFARVPDAGNVAGVSAAMTLVHQRDAATRIEARIPMARATSSASASCLRTASRGVSFLRGDLSSRLVVLLAMVGVLLAITCGNVASLLVARASSRERELPCARRSARDAGGWCGNFWSKR